MKKLLAILLLLASTAFAGEVTEQGLSQGDLVKLLSDLKNAANSCALADFNLTASAAAIHVNNTGAYRLNGGVYSITATFTDTFTAGHSALSASQQCVFTVGLDSSGNVGTSQSRVVSTSVAAPTPVDPPANHAPIGYITVAGAFTPNSTSLTSTAIAVTYTDVSNKTVSMTQGD